MAGTPPCDFRAAEEPAGWQTADFDASDWSPATVHTANAVGPKDGYYQITWNANAQLIWGPHLQTDNTILCRVTVAAP